MVESNKKEILEELGVTGQHAGLYFSAMLTVLLLFSCFGAVSSIVMIHASVALGQLFSSHRVLGAVVSYFVISTVISVLSFIVMVFFGHEVRLLATADLLDNSFNFIAYMTEVMKLSAILMSVTSILLYIMTHYIMNKKINLI